VRQGSLALIAVAVIAAGCGGGADSYANLSEHSAERQALDSLARQVSDPGSGLYRHRLHALSATKSHEPSGQEAWRVVVADRSGPRICLYTWREATGATSMPHNDAAPCESTTVLPPPGMGGSLGSS